MTAALVAMIALVGVAGLHHATRWGVGLAPDSTVYIAMARGLVEGRGFSIPSWQNDEFRPVTRFPPAYPAVLATAGLVGLDPLRAARPLNCVLLALNLCLVGFGLFRATGGRAPPAVAGAALAAFSAQLLKVHGSALSEPLFILLGFSGALALVAHLEEPRQGRLLLAAGLTGLAFLTRYAGAAFVGSGMLALLVVGGRSVGRRTRDAATFGAIAGTPMALWLARNLATGSTSTGRTFAYHRIVGKDLESAFGTMSDWLGVSGTAAWIVGGLLLSGVGIGLARAGGVRRLEPFPAVLLAFGVVYPGLLAVSLAFFDAHTNLNARILSPLLVALLLLVPYAIERGLRGSGGRAPGLLFAALTAVLVASYAHGALHWVQKNGTNGVEGFNSRGWRDSELIHYLAALPEDATIYTNGPDALYIHSGRRARYLPVRRDPGSRERNPGYASELAELFVQLRDERALVAWFNRIGWRGYRTTLKELRARLPLRRVEKLSDGSVWVHARGPGSPDET